MPEYEKVDSTENLHREARNYKPSESSSSRGDSSQQGNPNNPDQSGRKHSSNLRGRWKKPSHMKASVSQDAKPETAGHSRDVEPQFERQPETKQPERQERPEGRPQYEQREQRHRHSHQRRDYDQRRDHDHGHGHHHHSSHEASAGRPQQDKGFLGTIISVIKGLFGIKDKESGSYSQSHKSDYHGKPYYREGHHDRGRRHHRHHGRRHHHSKGGSHERRNDSDQRPSKKA